MSCSKELKEKAAEWWIQQFNTQKSNGEQTQQGMMDAISEMTKKDVSKECIEKFKEVMIRKIEERESDGSPYVYPIILDSDYGPVDRLRDIFVESGIDMGVCPYKTSMFVNENEIFVRDGYRAPRQCIYKEGDVK